MKWMVIKMSSSSSGKAEMGIKASVMTAHSSDGTGSTVNRQQQSIKIVHKASNTETTSGYIRINFDLQKKKDAYRALNKRLGEG